MHLPDLLKKRSLVIATAILLGSVVLSVLAIRFVTQARTQSTTSTAQTRPVATAKRPAPTATPILLPVESPMKILGVEGDPDTPFPGISWVRIPYPNCGTGDLYGDVLKSTIQTYHSQGIRVLLTLCQGPNNDQLYDPQPFADAASSTADAVQCGNEEMKRDASVPFLYIPPERFAKFYDLCEHAVHAAQPDIPVLLGSLDPHVGGVDYQPLLDQVNYLNELQQAMNTMVHPGGHWDWHQQILGMIDSWHNGYPDSNVNSLLGLFTFWAGQFHVDLNSGELGKHLWVVEGTGCFKDCGVSPDQASIAITHTLALITDVRTTMKYGVPFFYFSGKDFNSSGYHWPIGVLDQAGRPKPLRQDLTMGARSLVLSCSGNAVSVVDQEQLLSRLYSGCALPGDYLSTITN